MKRALCSGLGLALLALSLHAQDGGTHKDIVYATVDGKALALDLYLPPGVRTPPLVVWVHGGAWRAGTKAQPPMAFVQNGYALASLDFRQSVDARFPAQAHDIKAAIRFLRARARDFGYRVDRIAIAGSSSGGHLAALVGVSNGEKALEGSVGEYPNESSDIAAIIDYYGASNLMTILAQSTPHGLSVRKPALDLLLGAQPDAARDLAELASPVSSRRPQRSTAPHLSRRSGSTDADQPVARTAGSLRKGWPRRDLRRRPWRGARRRCLLRARSRGARGGVPAAYDRTITSPLTADSADAWRRLTL